MGTNWRHVAPTIPTGHRRTDLRFAGFWLVVRVLLGWNWLQTGWGLTRDAAWMSGDNLVCRLDPGVTAARSIVWQVACYGGDPSWVEGAAGAWAARTVAIAVTLIGIAVILGCLTRPAVVLAGLIMLLAVPPLAVAAAVIQAGAIVGLVAARQSAGWIGLDRWILPSVARWRDRRLRPFKPS